MQTDTSSISQRPAAYKQAFTCVRKS